MPPPVGRPVVRPCLGSGARGAWGPWSLARHTPYRASCSGLRNVRWAAGGAPPGVITHKGSEGGRGCLVMTRQPRPRVWAAGVRARCVPDRTMNRGDSRSLTDKRTHDLTCAHVAQRHRTRSLPSWSCGSVPVAHSQTRADSSPAPRPVGWAQAGSQRQPFLYVQLIASPSPATPDMPWSDVRQYSPGS